MKEIAIYPKRLISITFPMITFHIGRVRQMKTKINFVPRTYVKSPSTIRFQFIHKKKLNESAINLINLIF